MCLAVIDFMLNSAVDHLVNTASLGHTFYFEEAIDTSVFPALVVRAKCWFRTPVYSRKLP